MMLDFGYENLNDEIKRSMRRSAKEVVRLGYLLKRMMEDRLYQKLYDCFDEYLEKELHIDYSAANRFMNINRKYSVLGNSMEIAAEYEKYSQGLLIEMLSMPPELEAKVTPDMTVKQVREIKKQARADQETGDNIPGQTSIESDFPQCMPLNEDKIIDGDYREIDNPEEENIATSQPDEERAHDESWFVEQYVKIVPDEVAELFEICRKEQNNSDRAKAIQKRVAPCGYSSFSCSEYSFEFRGFTAGMDFRIGREMMHLKYGRFVVELMKLLEKETATPQPGNSAYGLEKTEYPEGSLWTTPGCGHKYDCFSCAQDCNIRQKKRYCRTAPLGNPFECDTMVILEKLKAEVGDRCQFVNNDLAYHTAGSNEADPCCRECNESCGYRCQRSHQPHNPATEDSNVESEEEYIPEGRLQVLKYLLEQKKGLLDFYSKAGCLSETNIRRDRSIVEALSDMVRDLEDINPASELEEITQPELPILKNNDQRKEWLADYKSWGLWYRDENIDVNYYKYDFIDGSCLVAAEYPQRHTYYSSEYRDEHYYHLLEKNKKGYKKPYDEQYRQQTDSETYLVEFLKELQKKG